MKKNILLFISLFIIIFFSACGSKEEELDESLDSSESTFKEYTKLYDQNIIPANLDMNLDASGTERITMFFTKEALEKNYKTLDVPFGSYDYLFLDKYDVNNRSDLYDGNIANCNFLNMNFDVGEGIIYVEIKIKGPSGMMYNYTEESFLNGFKPSYSLSIGGESYFYDYNYDGLISNVCYYSTNLAGIPSDKDTIKVLSAVKKRTSTYAGTFVSYYYGSKPYEYSGNNYQGYSQTLKIQQQLTHDLLITIEVSYETYEEVRNADEVGRYPNKELIAKWQEELIEPLNEVLKLYGIYDQAYDIINNGEDYKSEFNECI